MAVVKEVPVILLLLDTLFRRCIVPLCLAAGAVFRYNAVSGCYLLLLLISFALPPTRNSSHAGFYLAFSSLTTLLSLSSLAIQCFFQIILATDYQNDFSPCNATESTWRQFGFILFSGTDSGYPGPAYYDVIRYLAIDLGIAIASVSTLIVSGVTVGWLRKQAKHPATDSFVEPSANVDNKEDVDSVPISTSDTPGDARPRVVSVQISHSQPFIQVPDSILVVIEILFLLMLSLCASVVPSVTACIYLIALLVLLFVWSIHVPVPILTYGVRILMMVYSGVHLMCLYLFQFSFVQTGVSMGFDAVVNVTVPLGLRLTGMTPVIFTNCSEPADLSSYEGVVYSHYLNPGCLLLLCYFAALDFRLRFFKPRVSWSTGRAVYFASYSPHYWVSFSDPPTRRSTPTLESARSSPYNSIPLLRYPRDTILTQDTPTGASSGSREEESGLSRAVQFTMQIVFAVSFGVALVAMMAWSIVFPSWLTFFLLLWACIIWIFPFVYPNMIILLASPPLVLYSTFLLVLHYVTFLDLTPEEFNRTALAGMLTNQVVPNASEDELGLHFPYVFMQIIFTAAFFLAVYTLVRNWKEIRGKKNEEELSSSSSELAQRPPLFKQLSSSTATKQLFLQLKDTLLYYVSFYWVVVTMAAFLIAALVGPPSLFKVVYMVGFVLSILIYQVFRKHWYPICRVIWWGYILYSFLELSVIYIYQFRPVSTRILSSLTNNTGNETLSVLWLESLGFPRVEENESYTVADLMEILLPPTFFIAVLAMQLRYFYPKPPTEESTDHQSLETTVTDTARTIFRNAVNASPTSGGAHREDDESEVSAPLEPTVAEESETRQDEGKKSAVAEDPFEEPPPPTTEEEEAKKKLSGVWTKVKTWTMDLLHALWFLLRAVVSFVNQIFWQFLDIHLHKIISLVIFYVVLDRPGAGLVCLLGLVLLSMPLRQLYVVFFPILTLYLGAVVICEMIFQLNIIGDNLIDLSNNRCTEWNETSRNGYSESLLGPTLAFPYSPRTSDGSWFGLYKVRFLSVFSAGHIAAILLMALWFSVKRRMKRFYEKDGTDLQSYDKGALFLGVSRRDAEKDIVRAIKFLINHFFDYYGLQVCCAMVAIVMTSRHDVYSSIYGFLLGACLLMLFLPRTVVMVIWPILTYLVGVLIAIQYVSILGVPNGACLRPDSSLAYPWSFPDPWRRYLFLPDYVDTLDKFYLYADFILFLVMALQTFRIFKEAQHSLNLPGLEGTDGNGEVKGGSVRFWRRRAFLNKCREYLFGNWFWVSIFLLFLVGALRVSLFGFVYLIMCFVMIWKGREMLAADTKRLWLSWEVVRFINWAIMVLRAVLLILGCVSIYPTSEAKCLSVLLLDADCPTLGYYYKNPSAINCTQYGFNTTAVGVGADAALFVALTIQIIILQTKAFARIQANYRKALQKGQGGAAIFDRLVKERLVANIKREKEHLEEINGRLALLRLEQGTLVAHKMHAGVQIPKDIKVLKSSRQTSAATSGRTTPHLDKPPTQLWSSLTERRRSHGDDHNSSTDADGGIYQIIKAYVEEFYFLVLNWLEDQSLIYRSVQSELGRMETPRLRSLSPSSTLGSSQIRSPLEEPTVDSTETRPDVEVQIEPSGDSRGVGYRRDRRGSHNNSGDGHIEGNSQSSLGDGQDKPSAVHERDHLDGDESLQRASGKFDNDDSGSHLDSSQSEEIPGGEVDRQLIPAPALVAAGDDDGLEMKKRPTLARNNSVNVVLDRAETLGGQAIRLLQAVAFFLLANTAHVCYFFLILSVINNGSVLALIYAVLLFFWGLLTVPTPTKRFWLAMIVYAMSVLLLTYGFQFAEIDVVDDQPGLPVLPVFGLQYKENFLARAIWDILLLFSLVIHRAILKESGLWRNASLQIAVISDIHKEVREEDSLRRRRNTLSRQSSGPEGNHDGKGRETSDSLSDRSLTDDYVVVVNDDDSDKQNFENLETAAIKGSVSIWQKLRFYLLWIFGGAVKFYKKAVNPNITFGARDFYVVLFILDAICFFIIVIGFSSFGLGRGDVIQVASFIQQNNVPLLFLIVLLIQFLSMVTDRLIYLKKSIAGKLVFNLIQVVGWHAYLFFILPAYTSTPFLSNPYAQALYFFKAWYMIISSLQVISGYPYHVLGYFWGKKTDIISGSILIVYRLIPLIPFLRIVMDWTVSTTSLRFKQYITIEEIWAQLFQKSVFRKWERDSPRDLGAAPSALIKLLMGGGLIVLCIALLWGPLLLVSSIQENSQANPPFSFSSSLSISGFPPLFTMDAQAQDIREFTGQQFQTFEDLYSPDHVGVASDLAQGRFRVNQFTLIVLEGSGNLLWTISPPAREALIASLNNSDVESMMEFDWQVGRQPGSGLIATSVKGSHRLNLSASDNVNIRVGLVKILKDTTSNPSIPVRLPNLFPRIINAPPTGESKADAAFNVLYPQLITCELFHNRTAGGEWWSLNQDTRQWFPDADNQAGLEFIIFSDRISAPVFDFILGRGIIGLYFAYVLVVANLLSTWMSNLFYRLTFEETPNPDYLLELCESIFIARENGELVLEEILAGHLVYIFRSNSKFLEWTKYKQD